MKMTTEQVENVKDTAESILRMQAELHEKIMHQNNQIRVALAYIRAGQPNLATLVLEGMEP